MTTIIPAVAKAIEETRCTFEGCDVEAEADGSGGAIVVVKGVPMGCPYVQTEIWFGFRITFQYPAAEVYPHHVRPDLARKDGRVIAGKGLHPNKSFEGRTSLMLSRVSKRRDVRDDTAVTKLRRVLTWVEQCP